jgi:hypothetical protein
MKRVQTIEMKAVRLKAMEKEKATIKKESQTMMMKEKSMINSNIDIRENLKKCSLETNKVLVIKITIWSLKNK